MKVLLYGRNGTVPMDLADLVSKYKGLEIVKTNPDVVVTFGGDGTLIGSEAVYPGIPKLPLKNSENCHLCYINSNEELLELLSSKKLMSREMLKLEARYKDKKILAFNDIVIAHARPNSAIRFQIDCFGEKVFIGDGLVCSSPFGSTGYFYSITRLSFKIGIGVALNNIHNSSKKELVLQEDSKIVLKLLRGPAVLAWDNEPKIIELLENEEIEIKKSEQKAIILAPKN
jgi:NAD kinase